jgi:hypothetical protein
LPAAVSHLRTGPSCAIVRLADVVGETFPIDGSAGRYHSTIELTMPKMRRVATGPSMSSARSRPPRLDDERRDAVVERAAPLEPPARYRCPRTRSSSVTYGSRSTSTRTAPCSTAPRRWLVSLRESGSSNTLEAAERLVEGESEQLLLRIEVVQRGLLSQPRGEVGDGAS